MTATGPRILLVEDDKIFSDILTRRFREAGAVVHHAGNGQSAIAALDQESLFDLMLLDVSLPDIDGFDILSRIRTLPSYAQTPVIIVSNFVKRSDLEWGQKMGVRNFIQKSSVMPDEILRAAWKALGKEPEPQKATSQAH